jgi:hypothetical protein
MAVAMCAHTMETGAAAEITDEMMAPASSLKALTSAVSCTLFEFKF